MALSTAFWIVGGFLTGGLGLMSWLASSIENRPLVMGIVLTVSGGAMFVWGYLTAGAGFGLADVPVAFIEVLAYFIGR